MGYVHIPDLAPTKEMLFEYRKRRINWDTYEVRFLDLMRRRRIHETTPRETLADGCLLCSEEKPHHCHRRLVAEYLRQHWGDMQVIHLGSGGARKPEPERSDVPHEGAWSVATG